VDTCNSEALPEAGFPKKSKTKKEERISKKELLLKIIIFWMSAFVCVFIIYLIFTLAFICFSSELPPWYLDLDDILSMSRYSLMATVFSLLLFFIAFYISVLMAVRNDDLYVLRPADDRFTKLFVKNAYRVGHYYVGIKLYARIENEMPNKRISKLIKFLKDEKNQKKCPVIIRSHIFTAARWRDELTEQLKSEGMAYSIETGLPLQNSFKLTFVTAAIAALSGKIPSMYAHEAEIVVFPLNKTDPAQHILKKNDADLCNVANVPSCGDLGGSLLKGINILEIPPQTKPISQSIIDIAKESGVVIRDTNGKVCI